MKKYMTVTTGLFLIIVTLIWIAGCDKNDIIKSESGMSLDLEFVIVDNHSGKMKKSGDREINQGYWPEEFIAEITITGDNFEDIQKEVTVVEDSGGLYYVEEYVEVPIDEYFDISVVAEIEYYYESETYVGQLNNLIVSEGASITRQIYLLLQQYTDYDLRVRLTWGMEPSDLDLHMWTPNIEGSEHHVYYGNPGSFDYSPYTYLDVDDTNGEGPEVMTIVQAYPGTYYTYVHNFSSEVPLAGCGAAIQVQDIGGNLLQSLTAPSTGSGEYWNLFTIDGSTNEITVINQISDTPIEP